MKSLYIIIITAFFHHVSLAQITKKSDCTLQKKKNEREIALDSIKQLVISKSFALNARLIKGRKGRKIREFDPYNFIMIQDNKSTIQTSSFINGGSNAMGGATVKGNITKYEINNEKNAVALVIQSFSEIWGNTNMYIRISSNGNFIATLRGTGNNNSLDGSSWIGEIAPINHSTNFEGRSLINN